jgi:hypothetical protein
LLPAWRDPAAWATTADIFVILIALSLPWSTSLVGDLRGCWLVCDVRRRSTSGLSCNR